MTKLWGGCFNEHIDNIFEKLNSSINIDKRLWKSDIKGSKAYAKALHHANILAKSEMLIIIQAFDTIYQEWKNNKFIILDSDEDIHTANERRLKELIGPETGGKIHTGRSRNDQVTTDMKLFIREEALPNLLNLMVELMDKLTQRALEFAGKKIEEKVGMEFLLFPGYTHLQKAQPVSFSHWLLSYASAFQRDYNKIMSPEGKFSNLSYGTSTLTLGSGALAGNPLPGLDRLSICTDLGFTEISTNSMDATSDRDFIVDILYWISMVGIHLSKLAEDLILYSSKGFGYIILADAFTTGSSLMPQKKNPDSLEIIRGKSAKFISNLNSMQIILKGLPSTYNKDLQDDKELIFDSTDNLSLVLAVMIGVINTFKVDRIACKNALSIEMLSTDVAYYLVKKGVAFRDAHHVAGNVVAYSQKMQKPMNKLLLSELKEICVKFDEDVFDIWDYKNSVEQYQAIGGTSFNNVIIQIRSFQNFIEKSQSHLLRIQEQTS